MKKAFRKYGLMALAAAFCAIGMQGCFVDSDCYTRTSCSTVCDWWTCYDDCWDDYICEDDYDYRPGGYNEAQCYDNRDCDIDSYCEDGRCYQYNSGSVPFCGQCDITDDCKEGGAVCVNLGDSTNACLRLCDYDRDCPEGFSCLDMEGVAPGSRVSSKQCYPKNESCDASYCRDSNDCVQNADCINHRCEVSTQNLNECSRKEDCSGYGADYAVCYTSKRKNESYCTQSCFADTQCDPGYSCYLAPNRQSNGSVLDSGICLTPDDGKCVFSSDCGDGMLCNDGKCMLKCSSDRDCYSDYISFSCVSGVCRF